MRGRFITFEGGEGTGKSTHSILLSDRLEALGIDVVLTRVRALGGREDLHELGNDGAGQGTAGDDR